MSPSAFAQLCKKQLPIALALGMSADEFWNADVSLFWAYVRAGEIKRKQEDYAAWAQGYYIDLAFADVLGQLFAEKGRAPKRVYPEKPLFTEDKSKAKKKALPTNAAEAAYQEAAANIRAKFMALNAATNAPLEE